MSMIGPLRFRGTIKPATFLVAAPIVWLSQHLLGAVLILAHGSSLRPDRAFWLLPLREAALLPGQPMWAAALAFSGTLASSAGLALFTFRRANWSGRGHALAAFACVPGVQVAALAIVAVLPRFEPVDAAQARRAADVALGLLAGIGLIVLAVLVSAVLFGAYGWGLFVATPFTVGVTTGWLANRGANLSLSRTLRLVMASTAIGTLALVMFALEGILCIVMAAPLGAGVAAIGGALGRRLALGRRNREARMMSVAILPAIMALDLALPPAIVIPSEQSVDIQAPPEAVWAAIVSGEPVARSPGLIAAAGLAYPVRSKLLGEGAGAQRLGYFSTGVARERVTTWIPMRTLAFTALSQPPAMAEMSPYREVHTPHVSGYFTTTDTRFDLAPLTGGGTRLTIRGSHVLRMDPVLYWEPLARIAIRLNVARVLADIDTRARSAGYQE